MINDLLQQLRAVVEKSPDLSDEAKAKLIAQLNEMPREEAAATVGKVEARTAISRLNSSIEELEGAHPDLTNLIGRIATVLANMGI